MKTAAEYYSLLNDNIDGIRNKKITPAEVNGTCNSVGKILGVARMQLDYAKAHGLNPPFIGWLASGHPVPETTAPKKAK